MTTFSSKGRFMISGPYELYSLRTVYRFCSRMEREDNVILIVIKHYLGVGISDVDVYLETAFLFTRYFEMYSRPAKKKYKN